MSQIAGLSSLSTLTPPRPAARRKRGLSLRGIHSPMRASTKWRRRIAVLLASIATGLLTIFFIGLATALPDSGPDGPGCYFEADPGSGPSGDGTEDMRWGLLPTKYCISDTDVNAAFEPAESNLSPGLVLEFFIWTAGVAAGLFTLVAGSIAIYGHPQDR